ncbi:MAG TPA: 2-succinyl-5-enolpyruvyl-6-hydroxy-3-cyclohexene-1-carboxylic-acid synthase, partial [Planococcus sp. (in: firmicutes)]|nr:2-succinyl-5-enolpyruvyl-6-hydroxy-3-cyclohexene-1-carboxylic-acid synthase [Planococcus sp. (in: firmicutes)]
AANYFPGIVEAFYARVPLLVVTADRPHELREVGAPQAINQIQLFGDHVKWSVDLPLPETENKLGFLARHLHRSVAEATSSPQGPVHLNVPFREPLGIDFDQPGENYRGISFFPRQSDLSNQAEAFLLETLKQPKGLLVLGESTEGMPEAFWAFIEKLQWPVLADPLSNVRGNMKESCKGLIIDSYDALLKNERFQAAVEPDAVIRIGPQPVSKSLTLYLANIKPENYIVIDDSAMLRDAQSIATHHIQASANSLWKLDLDQQPANDYAHFWSEASELYWELVKRHCEAELDEGVLAETFMRELNHCDLIVGSSMPIRDVDTYFRATERDVLIYANRGANGIDGVVSTAFGVQAAKKRPAYLYIGDLSFLHDMNGLIAAKLQKTDLTIILMNNDGGGIFSYLPQSQEERYFEDLFGTPTGLAFKDAASMYGTEYAEVHTKDELLAAMRSEKRTPVKIIEVFTDRQNNVQVHRKLWKRLNEELERDAD